MIPIRLVFLIVVISMILSSAVFGGESPNDRIDTLLSLMTGMSERVDKLIKNVGNMETNIKNINKDVSKLENEMVEVKSDVAEVKKSVGWKFVGMGGTVTADDIDRHGPGHTLAGCWFVHKQAFKWLQLEWYVLPSFCWVV